jgi:hypothetical protein
VKEKSVHGVIVSAGSTWLVLHTNSGSSITVHTTSHTTVTFNQRATALPALFPGAHVVARVVPYGRDVLANTVTGSARQVRASGRLTLVSGSALSIRHGSGKVVAVDLLPSSKVTDAGHTVNRSTLQVGAFLQVSGYAAPSRAIRATTIAIVHPALDLHGTFSRRGKTAVIALATGEQFVAHFSRSSVVHATHLTSELSQGELPSGVRVHATGQADSGGAILVHTLDATLRSASVRAQVASIGVSNMALRTTSLASVQLLAETTVAQGSHTLTAVDIVAGDDVTVSGYVANGNVLLARRIAVHRKLTGFDATVAAVTGPTLTVTAANASRTVFLSGSTIITGPAGAVVSAGMKVHITGYLRGDGVVLATRVRILHSP